MNTRKLATQAGLVVSTATLGLGTILAPAAVAATPSNGTPHAWSCREMKASKYGAEVDASICWQSGTAKVAGQIYDAQADGRSACAQVQHSSGSPYNYCDKGGFGSSKHFVTGEFKYTKSVLVRACTESSLDVTRCSSYR